MCLMLAKWFYISNVGVQARPEAVACNDGLGVAARKMPYVGCKKQKYAGDRGDG